MTPSQHAGRVKADGSLVLNDRPAWLRAIARHKGREVTLSIRRLGSADKPSKEVHGYYRSTVLPLLAEEWGWGDPQELHTELKRLHLPAIIPTETWPKVTVGQYQLQVPPSMADFTVEQASRYLDAVLAMAADAGIAIPAPRGSE